MSPRTLSSFIWLGCLVNKFWVPIYLFVPVPISVEVTDIPCRNWATNAVHLSLSPSCLCLFTVSHQYMLPQPGLEILAPHLCGTSSAFWSTGHLFLSPWLAFFSLLIPEFLSKTITFYEFATMCTVLSLIVPRVQVIWESAVVEALLI